VESEADAAGRPRRRDVIVPVGFVVRHRVVRVGEDRGELRSGGCEAVAVARRNR
jgi:hypothetical protein